MGLNARQKKVIELYAEGTPVTDIAKICGVSRTTIYADLDNDDVKAGVDTCLTEIKSQVEKQVVNKLDSYVSELDKLALTSKSEKTKLDALQYLMDRGLGKPSSKTSLDIQDKREDDGTSDDMLADVLGIDEDNLEQDQE